MEENQEIRSAALDLDTLKTRAASSFAQNAVALNLVLNARCIWRRNITSTPFILICIRGWKTMSSAADILERYRNDLEGRYAREPLDLFSVFLDEALERHRLSTEAYADFAGWLEENYEKMADDWIVKEQYERTFYGFASYKDPASLNVRVDTAPFNLLQKQQEMRRQGVAATPIFRKTVQYKESSAVAKVRRDFQDWMALRAAI